MWTFQEKPNAGIMLTLTFHLHDDWLRLYHSGADEQSAAILPSIHSLHMVNAVTQYMRAHVKLHNQPVTSFSTSLRHIPDSGEESCDPIGGGLEVVHHHLYVSCQFLAILHPGDGLEPAIIWVKNGNIDGAVEFSLMAL